MVECTFKPLSRGRYRCNQTSVVVKQAQLDRYRRMRLGQVRKRTPRQPPPVTVSIPHGQAWAECPTCRIDMFVKPDKIETCGHCRTRFKVKFQRNRGYGFSRRAFGWR